MNKVEVIPVTGLPIVKEGDDLACMICQAAEKQGTPIQKGDIIVVTHVIVSRAEGNVVNLETVTPSEFAKNVAEATRKDPKLVEVILWESLSIVRMSDGKLITETKRGVVCANSGIDRSNVPGNSNVALLPKDADQSARVIKRKIRELTQKDVAVIVSDTHGRPLRRGEINIALGTAGFEPLRDRRGEKDLFGYTIRIKRTAIADELASAAELVIGQTDEAVPVAIIRGYPYPKSEKAKATKLIRPRKEDLFI
ncbi:MAG TPA: coenzyme F420-0:L-glutamate ligase [Candidatus Bathyarchaeota archaeon]|nr:coenzyme F420-0:L-glutamate ligase [Candidatus Bathyarchaeota archaeon]